MVFMVFKVFIIVRKPENTTTRSALYDWHGLRGSVVERRSLIGELSLVCT